MITMNVKCPQQHSPRPDAILNNNKKVPTYFPCGVPNIIIDILPEH